MDLKYTFEEIQEICTALKEEAEDDNSVRRKLKSLRELVKEISEQAEKNRMDSAFQVGDLDYKASEKNVWYPDCVVDYYERRNKRLADKKRNVWIVLGIGGRRDWMRRKMMAVG